MLGGTFKQGDENTGPLCEKSGGEEGRTKKNLKGMFVAGRGVLAILVT